MIPIRQMSALPNMLTVARLFLIPFLVIAILDGHWRVAFTLFLLAGLSDAADGLLARWLHQKTVLGLYLDPIADKLMLSTLFIVLTLVGMVPRYVTVLVFSRDLGILLIATLLFATGTLRDFHPSRIGKLSTVIQIVALTLIIGSEALGTSELSRERELVLQAVALLAPLSAAHYAWVVIQRMQHPTTAVPIRTTVEAGTTELVDPVSGAPISPLL